MSLEDDIRQLLKRPDNASYVVEVYFQDSFSRGKSNVGIVSVWKYRDEGLEKIYQCPKCRAVLEEGVVRYAKQPVQCHACGAVMLAMEMAGETLYGLTVSKWATKLAEYLRLLKMDSDVILKRSKRKGTIIEAEMISKESAAGLDLLQQAREKEGAHYKKNSILKDLQGGASLDKALEAFLLA